MPVCKECGFSSSRLQWTHFRYKCSGRFKNSQEYLAVYPGSQLVDNELAKRTAVTLENLILKYGESDALDRWNDYKSKQAISNLFETKQKKFGWTEEQFIDFNKSRSVTIENLINKHGEEVGTDKWYSYCERQAYTNSREYFVEKYGVELGEQKINEVNRLKASAGHGCGHSMVEKEFVDLIESQIGPLEYSYKTKPFVGRYENNNQNNRWFLYDIKHKDCIIEFNGDYWHGNPAMYSADDVIRGNPVKDIWDKDSLKMGLANQLGFRTLVVWESDYYQDKFKKIEEVIKWIQIG